MAKLKSIQIDGENIVYFNSAIYLFHANSGCTLQLDIIVSEITIKKYTDRESHIIEVELENGSLVTSFMTANILPGRIPHLNFVSEVEDADEYSELPAVHENDLNFPDIEQGITLEEIRKVEMPYEKVALKLTLPIDQAEWLQQKTKKELNAIFKELLEGRMK
ncbi:MAG: hypothetical protein AB2374_11235 [Cytobacillus gottheilii]|uniref:hypothetical protein n=1 Tax=Cytobacillus gottheilii TaxID=859144 RepID=UPI003463A6F3